MIRSRVLTAMPYAWAVVALSLVGQMGGAFANQGIPTLYPFIQEDFGISRAQLGLLTSGLVMGGTATALLTGWLADALGVRRLLTVTLVGVAVGVLVFSQTRSLVQGVLLALLISAASSASFPATVRAIMDWVRPRTRSLAMGIKETSIPIGGIMTAALLPFLAVTFSWRSAVMALALMIVVSSVVFFAFYRDSPHASSTEGKRGSLGRSIPLVARNREIWLAALCGTTFMALQMVFVSYLILFLKEDLGMSAVVAGGFLAVAQASSAVGRVAWGLVSDFLLRGRRVLVLALVGMLSVASMAFMTWLPSDASLVVVGVLVFGVGSAAIGWHGVYTVLLAELAGPALTGTAIGFASMIMRVGAFGIPPLFGLVVDRTGSYDMGWWMMAGLAGVGTLPLAFLRPQARRR